MIDGRTRGDVLKAPEESPPIGNEKALVMRRVALCVLEV